MSAGKIYGRCERVVGHICGRGIGCEQTLCGATATRLFDKHPVCGPCEEFLIETDRQRMIRQAFEKSRPKSQLERLCEKAEALAEKLARERSEAR